MEGRVDPMKGEDWLQLDFWRRSELAGRKGKGGDFLALGPNRVSRLVQKYTGRLVIADIDERCHSLFDFP